MKRTFKKAFAALTATAIAASSFAVTSFAAVTNANGEGDAEGSYFVDLNTVSDISLDGIRGAVVTMTLADGWTNTGVGGGIIFMGDGLAWADGSKEINVSGGGTANESDAVGSTVSGNTLTCTYDFGSALFVEGATWGQLQVQSWWGADFTVDDIKYLDLEGNVIGAEEETPEDPVELEYIELKTGSLGEDVLIENEWAAGTIYNPTITLDNKWGNAFAVEGYSHAEITYTCENPSEIKNIYLVAQSGTMPNSWYQAVAAPAESGTITLDFSNLQDKTYECLLVQVQPADTYAIGDTFDPGFTVTSAKLYKIPTEDDSAYAGSTSVEIAEGDNSWWKEVVISKEELIGDIDPATIEKVVFSTNSAYNFGIGYNGTELIGTNDDGSDNYWIDASNGSSDDIELYDINFDHYGLMAILAPGSVGTYEISWKVYTKAALVESLNGTSVTLGDTIGVNLYLDLGEEILADEEAVVEYFFADGECYSDLVSYGESTDNGYKFTVNVDAKEMTDEFTAQVVAGDGRRGELYTVSVKEYADQIINAEEGTYSDETIALVKAMLVYGGYAQEYFDYNTDNLASAGLDTSVSSARITDSYDSYVDGTLPEGMSFYGASLILEDTTTVRLYFTATAELAEAYLPDAEQIGDYYCCNIASGVTATEIDDIYTITIEDCTIEYGVLSYAYKVINSSTNEELINLVKALRLYNVAADNYAAA